MGEGIYKIMACDRQAAGFGNETMGEKDERDRHMGTLATFQDLF